MMKYGDRIASLRDKLGITQETLAKSIGISRAALSHYEKNRREPDFDTLNKLADYFGVTADYLLTGRNVADLPDPFQDYFRNPVRNQLDKLVTKDTEIELNGTLVFKIPIDMTIKQVIDKYFYHIPQFKNTHNFQVFYDGPGDNLRFSVFNLIKENIPLRKHPDPQFLSYSLSNLVEYSDIDIEEFADYCGVTKDDVQKLIDKPSELPSDEIINKMADYLQIPSNMLIGLTDFHEQENRVISGEEIKLTPEELKIFEELKKHPILFHDLASDPEKKIKELIKLQKAKKLFLEEDEEEYGDGFGDIED